MQTAVDTHAQAHNAFGVDQAQACACPGMGTPSEAGLDYTGAFTFACSNPFTVVFTATFTLVRSSPFTVPTTVTFTVAVTFACIS